MVQFIRSASRLQGISELHCSVTNPPGLNGNSFSLLGAHDSLLSLQSSLVVSGVTARALDKHKQIPPVASLTSFLTEKLRERSLLQLFNHIDTDRRGRINVHDLEVYAQCNGLPVAYVEPFVSAVRLANGEPDRGADWEEEGLDFRSFRTFVQSRELALKKAFDLFDRDQDGVISVEDLDFSLAHVAVCCPKSRCIYRARRQCLNRLLSQVDKRENERGIRFSDFRQFFLLLPRTDLVVEYWLDSAAAGRCCDLGTRLVVQDPSANATSPWGHLIAGAMAGAVSRTVTAPLETIRLAWMAGTIEAGVSLPAAARQLMASSGWCALYRGNLVNVLGSAPRKALDFFAFDTFKNTLGVSGTSLGGTHAGRVFFAAGLAGACSWLALYPLEVIRSRMTLDVHGKYGNLLACLSTVVRKEGLSALYRGVVPSMAAIFPEAAITYGLHDLLKGSFKRIMHQDPGVMPSLTFGVLSALTGQLVAYPLETVSRRLQLAGVNGGPSTLGGVVNGLLNEGGVQALYRGIGAASLRILPMAMVSFGTYEVARSVLVYLEQKSDEDLAKREYQELHVQPLQLLDDGCNVTIQAGVDGCRIRREVR